MPLYRLLAWLSPAYPIGAFSYSHGIETAVEEGFIKDRASLVTWLRERAAARHRRGRRRAVRRRLAGRRGRGLAGLRRHRRARGRVARHVGDGARNRASRAARSCRSRAPPGRIPRSMRRTSAWRASCRCRSPWRWPPPPMASPSSAAARRLPARLHRQPDLGRRAHRAARPKRRPAGAGRASKSACAQRLEAALVVTSLDEVGTATPLLDWCSLRHETQYTRLFRS